MLRHVVLFRWVHGAGDAERLAVSEGLASLPHQIDSLRSYRFGPDAQVNDGNWDFAIVAEFDDLDGYLAYRDDPVHQQLIADVIAPIVEHRAAVQYEVTP